MSWACTRLYSKQGLQHPLAPFSQLPPACLRCHVAPTQTLAAATHCLQFIWNWEYSNQNTQYFSESSCACELIVPVLLSVP